MAESTKVLESLKGTVFEEVGRMMSQVPISPKIRDMDPNERADLAREVELEMREIQRQPD